jgi:quinol monooxygenase YgiN
MSSTKTESTVPSADGTSIGYQQFGTDGQAMPSAASTSDSRAPKLGFAVIYRWTVDPSKEDQFRNAWEELTQEIRETGGGLGSRLHKASDGTWLAYAQWPSKEMWERESTATISKREALQRLNDAVEERLPPIELQPIADHLVHSRIS